MSRATGKDDESPTPHLVQFLSWDENGKEHVHATQPASAWAYSVWCELVRARVDHDAARRLALRIFARAMGMSTALPSFNGMAEDEPAKQVGAERDRLARAYRDLRGEVEKLADLIDYHDEGKSPLLRDIHEKLRAMLFAEVG